MRCQWAINHQLEQDYHDIEWGVPVYDDQKLFEILTLEGAQAGLSWLTVLKKRKNYNQLFSNFEIEIVANYTDKQISEILQNPGIIRHKLKINSVVTNAKCILKTQKEYDSFAKYIWSFVDFKPIDNAYKIPGEVPSETEISKRMSKDLKKRGFKFVGSTICYAFMQASGMVNDHTTNCFRYRVIKANNLQLRITPSN
jgi:DNA-3-methyladenine glycosylase I